jgi:hypothetical protein
MERTDDEVMEHMMDLWLEHINVWAKSYDGDAAYEMTRDNYPSYHATSMVMGTPYVERMELKFVSVNTDDELHWFGLLGVVEDGKLVYMTSLVDTDWAEVWKGEYPSGQIDLSKPYERIGKFLSTPEHFGQQK